MRLFVTFLSAMDRARNSELLWNAGFNLFNSHPELFDPISIYAMSIDTLFNRLKDSNVSQRHSDDVNAWRTIGHSLTSDYQCSVQKVIDDGVGNAEDLLRELKSVDRTGQPRFPLLKGEKIGPMWVRILANPGKAIIHRIDIIPVAVDIHVCRVTENLGVVDRRKLNSNRDKDRKAIQSVWRNAVETAEIGGPSGIENTCAALDPALWYFGKLGCSHCEKLGQITRISSVCSHCQFEAPRDDVVHYIQQNRQRYQSSSRKSNKFSRKVYWAELQQVIDAVDGPYSKKPRTPQEENWMSYSVGHSEIKMYIFISRKQYGRNDNISVELTTTNKEIYKNLVEQKLKIENELGYELVWQERPNSKESRICICLPSTDARKLTDWKRQHQWFSERMNEFHRVFSCRVKEL